MPAKPAPRLRITVGLSPPKRSTDTVCASVVSHDPHLSGRGWRVAVLADRVPLVQHMGVVSVGKKQKRRPRRENWTRPPVSAEKRAAEEEVQRLKAAIRQPPLPQRRLIAALFTVAVITFAAFLVFVLPARSLVNDLRSRGVSVAAEVVSAPKNKYGGAGNVKVRFAGPDGEVDTELNDWGGERPEGLREGTAVLVTYDPGNPRGY